jgi:hypothetical protein
LLRVPVLIHRRSNHEGDGRGDIPWRPEGLDRGVSKQEGFNSVLKHVEKTTPQYAPYLKSYVAQLPGRTKFFAADLGARFVAHFSSNVFVFTVGGAGFPATLDDFTNGVQHNAQGSGLTIVHTTGVRIGKVQAYRSDGRQTIPQPATLEGELFLPHGDGFTQVEVTTTDDPAGASLIDSVLASVHPLS